VFLVVLFAASATFALVSFDDGIKGGVLYNLAHYFRYITSGFRQR
jgi:hypothetical protein